MTLGRQSGRWDYSGVLGDTEELSFVIVITGCDGESKGGSDVTKGCQKCHILYILIIFNPHSWYHFSVFTD